ncbi:MAG: DUF4229 domain-containing protein [Actinomycetota bacterium]|nr:DUF4229 domain-containing protein [Actinomycetota bacterium]
MVDAAPQATRGTKAVAIIVYTVLRLGLFVAAWLLIVLLTPVKGIWAAAAGILISGAISLVLLDRQRSAVGAAVSGFVGRMNARIEASAAAEDSAEGEQDPEGKSVDQQ